MSRNQEFRSGLGEHFLSGFHEERTEPDPPDEREPEIARSVIR